MKKAKILLSLALILSLVLTLGVVGFADDGDVYVGDVMVTDNNADDIFGDGTASYDFSSSTLTLDGANITEGHYYIYGEKSAIYSKSDITIELKGENTIKIAEFGEIESAALIYSEAQITIKGTGSLDIHVDGSRSGTAINSQFKGVDILGDASVNVIGGELNSMFYGILCVEDVNISNNVKLDIMLADSTNSNAVAIWSREGIFTASDSVMINISGGSAEDSYYRGIQARNGMNFSGNSVTTINPGNDMNTEIEAIRVAADLTISDNASVSIKTANSGDEGNYGIYVSDMGNLIMSGGKLNIEMGDGAGSTALDIGGSVNISGGHVYSAAGDVTGNHSYGLYIHGDGLNISGGSIIAISGDNHQEYPYGANAYRGSSDINITGGAVKFIAKGQGEAMTGVPGSIPANVQVIGNAEALEVQFIAPGGAFGDTGTTATVPESTAITATASTDVGVSYDGTPITIMAYNINGNNFFKLRDFAMVVKGSGKEFSVAWDGRINAIALVTDQVYSQDGTELKMNYESATVSAVPSTASVHLNGVELDLEAYNIGGNNYFKLRDMCKALDISVAWNDATRSIALDSSMSYTD